MKSVFILILSLSFSLPLLGANDYTVGVGDVLEVNILRPDQSTTQVTVSPGGHISVQYIGAVNVKGKTITQIQRTIQLRLANGYLKYPIVSVSLIESHSKNYTISGEIMNPGKYPLEENTTVIKAISIAGGFTRFASPSKIKVLRPKKNRPGYLNIKTDIQDVIEGDASSDIVLKPGDIVIVSKGFF